jgi:predicted RNase H-like HicB family nuclease
MKNSYWARIEYNKADEVYEASFAEYPTINAFGKTILEAKEMAKDALDAYVSITKTLVEPVRHLEIKEKVFLRKVTVEV